MKPINFLYKLLILINALISFQGFSQNLLINGDFESGGAGTGFQTNYFLPATAGTSGPRDYNILTNSFAMNTANFANANDHSGTGKMMVVDGSTNSGDKVWELLNGSSIGVVSGRTYIFSYWIRSISATNTIANSAIIAVNTNGTTTAPVLTSGSASCPTGNPSVWTQVTYTWTATTNNAQIWITNNQTSVTGNDFALDDFSLVAAPLPLSLSYSLTNESCANSNDGTIRAYANNGVTPYVTYSLTNGGPTITNSTGFFTGLAPGANYTLSVIDSAGTIVSQTNITIGASTGLLTSNNVTICSGAPTTLSVSGGSTGYTWTASPADLTLTATTSATPTVSPTVTTLYTVTSTKNTVLDLITNGNFSNGNIGFDSDYTYYAPNNPTLAQKAYGIVVNPNTWEPGFSATCVDQTSGTGQMMVVDGSSTNAGNDLVWGQTMPVNAGQNYTFSFWAQSLNNGSPAVLRVVINGVTVGTLNLTTTPCNWTQFSPFVWNSGASTTAQVQLFDTNTSVSGNDFAIDDITFTTNTVCNLSASVQVDVNGLAPNVTCGLTTANSITFNWVPVTGATGGYTVSYQINSGSIASLPTSPSLNLTVNSLNPGDQVKITVTPVGSGCYRSTTLTCSTTTPCPVPVVSVTQQPTCTNPTGTIVFTSPVNTVLPIPSNLFISQVTDANSGQLTYIEIYNGTGATVNLANYKIKIYNNGLTTPTCDLALSGSLLNNNVVVIAVGSVTNLGGVVPDLTFAGCGGV
ncbi:MAG: hypothetical protein ACOYLP_08865, partial [Flavobacterium sp.]|uniref:hypothetical protein n=1 Tax=Flavobacterium sp. TaxID=239 RepID=UPI003BE3F7B1